MKSDREKARMWPEEHWALTKCICVVVAILGFALTDLEIFTARVAFAASLLAILYVVLTTYLCTRRTTVSRPRDMNR